MGMTFSHVISFQRHSGFVYLSFSPPGFLTPNPGPRGGSSLRFLRHAFFAMVRPQSSPVRARLPFNIKIYTNGVILSIGKIYTEQDLSRLGRLCTSAAVVVA